MTATRERVVNLRDWEARANQEGRLKLLVRPVKPQPNNPEVFGVSPIWGSCVPTEDTPGVRSGSIPAKCVGRYTIHAATNENGQRVDRWIACPYGKAGDRLRGREAWQSVPFGPHRDWPGCPDLRPRKTCELNRARVVIWRADGEMPGPEIWRPSIHMHRWAVRSWFEITEVRCGRVREMSQDDAIAGGVSPSHPSIDKVSREFGYPDFSRSMRAQIYEMDHGEGAWERDWVWMIGVKRIEVAS